MEYIPHEYQSYAIRYIEEHPLAALLLDCGLGKTSITLTALEHLIRDSFQVSKVLVIAPLRVANNTWPSELEKWDHLCDLRMSIVTGKEDERMKALSVDSDIFVINRENISWLIERSGYPFDFDCLVIDELSSFKSSQAKRFRSLLKVRPKVRRVIGLTGTPTSNGLMDLWAEYRLLDMGERLGRFITQYRLKWFQPDCRNGMQVFSWKPLPNAEKEIFDAISDITVSMKSTDHLRMPEFVYSEREVLLSDKEMDGYRTLKRELVSEWAGKELTASNAAVLTGKLMQMANGMVYGEDGSVEIHSAKLDAIEDLVEEANGNPVLVAYWYRHDLERIVGRLETLGVSFMDLRSDESIRKWNSGALCVGLIHPASAGHGLNLQEGGSTIIWFGPIWSLELYLQTNARLWRQGQKSMTVVVQHIVAKGTIDGRILEALRAKGEMQDKLLAAVKAEVSGNPGGEE